MTFFAALLLLLAGLAVGATSIGGILVVPILTSLTDMPLHHAIAASSFSFLFTGAAALGTQWSAVRPQQGKRRPRYGALYGMALLGAAAGALTLQWLPPPLVRMVIACLALLSGAMSLASAPSTVAAAGLIQTGREPLTLITGFCVGCASAWSGTGGPVVLLPLLILTRTPVLLAIEIAQGVQLPIASASTAVNILVGWLDLRIALLVGVTLIVGWAAGRILARRAPTAWVKQILAWTLIAFGVWYGWQTIVAMIG